MKLTELSPQFIDALVSADQTVYEHRDTIDADGIIFACPKCFNTNGGLVGTHHIVCWRPRVPLSEHLTGPGRWEMLGTGYADLTLRAGSSSVSLKGGCNAHFFIESGNVRMC